MAEKLVHRSDGPAFAMPRAVKPARAQNRGGRPRKQPTGAGAMQVVRIGQPNGQGRQWYRVTAVAPAAFAAAPATGARWETLTRSAQVARLGVIETLLARAVATPTSSEALTQIVDAICGQVPQREPELALQPQPMEVVEPAARLCMAWAGTLDQAALLQHGHVVLRGELRELPIGTIDVHAVQALRHWVPSTMGVLDWRCELRTHGGRPMNWVEATPHNRHLHCLHEAHPAVRRSGPRQLGLDEALRRLSNRFSSLLRRSVDVIVAKLAGQCGYAPEDVHSICFRAVWRGMNGPVWYIGNRPGLAFIVPVSEAATAPIEFATLPDGCPAPSMRHSDDPAAARACLGRLCETVCPRGGNGSSSADGTAHTAPVVAPGDAILFDTWWPHRMSSPPARGAALFMCGQFGTGSDDPPLFCSDPLPAD